MSKIHCIMLAKNEADIIGYCIRETMKWADFVYVYDNMSSDGTWEVVQSLANERIIAWKQHDKPFCEGLRADVFNEFRCRAKEGDWWFKVDADDFYRPQVRQELEQVPAGQNMVWTITVDYQITHEDLKEIDFSEPVETVLSRLKYFKVAYSEPRAFRHRNRLVWSPEKSWPTHAGIVARARPILRHFPHRSPQQLQMRLDVRRAARSRGFTGWDHASQTDWMEKIANRSDCQLDDGSGKVIVDESKIPRHIEPYPNRLLKLILHGAGIWP